MNKETLFKPIIETAVIETLMIDSSAFKELKDKAVSAKESDYYNTTLSSDDYYNQIISDCRFAITEVCIANEWDAEGALKEFDEQVENAKKEDATFKDSYTKEEVGTMMQAIFETCYKKKSVEEVLRLMRIGYRTLELKDMEFSRI